MSRQHLGEVLINRTERMAEPCGHLADKLCRPPSTRISATTKSALHSVDELSPLGERVHWYDPRDHQNCRL